jgi:predicted amidohydrolase YtcJ
MEPELIEAELIIGTPSLYAVEMLRLAVGITLGLTFTAANFFGETADLVIVNARVYTVNPRQPSATAIAIKAGRFLAVGDSVSDYVGAETRRIDVHGKAVIPGFIDSHGHMLGLGETLSSLDLHGVSSELEIQAMVANRARLRKPGEWITGFGWDQNLWKNKQFPIKDLLDSAAPDNPVVLTRVDGHAIWVNSEALTVTGVKDKVADPTGGRVMRDETGYPTGVFIDNAMDLVKVPDETPAQREADLEAAAKLCARIGLTTVHDAGIPAATLEAYRTLIQKNRLPIRINAMISGSDPDLWNRFLKAGPEIGDFLTVRSVKLYADGALGSRGAALLAPYSDDPKNSGLTITEQATIEKFAREAVKGGFQVCTHAIGDRANHEVLLAYAAALHGKNDKRFRVEHAQVVAPEDFARFRDNSIIASMQPTHATSDMPWAALRLGPVRIEGAYAWQTFLKLGVHLAFGSDFPVENPNPIWGFYAAVSRQDRQGNPDGGWFPNQRLTRAEALRSWTIEGAYAAFQETTKGSIEPGKFADFVVLSDDIMRIAPARIPTARVTMTVVNGRVVYQE